MAVLNPRHLLQQAERLAARSSAGPPRQVDLRRSVSAAYYAVFHFLLTAAADDLIGVTKKTTPRYWLVYRSIDHRALRELCTEAKKQSISAKVKRMAPDGFGSPLQNFATAVLELQERRHVADYDPSARIERIDANLAISTAQGAIRRFLEADRAHRQIFLALLLFPPR